MNFAEALDVVYYGIDMVNDLLPEEEHVTKKADVVLAGNGGCLDSLALVTLIIAIERKTAEVSGQEIILLDEAELDPSFARIASPQAIAELIIEKMAQ